MSVVMRFIGGLQATCQDCVMLSRYVLPSNWKVVPDPGMFLPNRCIDHSAHARPFLTCAPDQKIRGAAQLPAVCMREAARPLGADKKEGIRT